MDPGASKREKAVSLEGKALRLSIGTMLSRLSGFAREVVVAAYFGAGSIMDAFVAAYTVPALVRQVLGERALEAGFLPWFIRSRKERNGGGRLAREVALWLLVFGLAACLIIFALAPALVKVIGLGFDQETLTTSTGIARVLVPFVLIIAFAAFFGTILQARGKFLLYGVAPAFFSLGAIGSVLIFSSRLGIYSLAIGVLVGGILFALVQLPGCIRSFKSKSTERASLANPSREVRGVGRLVVPVIAGAGVEKLGTVTDRIIASLLAPGSISSLYFAFRLIQLPYSVLALAVGRVVGPKLAAEAEEPEAFRSTLFEGIALASFLLIPVSAISIALSDRIVAIVYARGSFGVTEVAMTGKALTYYSIGLAAMGFVGILSRAFASLLDTRTPVKVGAIGLAINIVLSFVLSRTFLTHGGVALATSVAFWFQALALWTILQSKIQLEGEAGRRLFGGLVKVIAAASITGGAIRYLAYRLQLAGSDGSTIELAWGFLIMAVCYAVVYVAFSSALGVDQTRKLLRAGKQRFRKGQ